MDICNDTYKVHLKCKNCGTQLEDYLDAYPTPDNYAETANASSDCTGGSIACPNCGQENDYSISVDFNGDEVFVPSDLEIIKE